MEFDPSGLAGPLNMMGRIQNFTHPKPGPDGSPVLDPSDTDTHEMTYASPAYRQGREALRISRQVRPGLKEQP